MYHNYPGIKEEQMRKGRGTKNRPFCDTSDLIMARALWFRIILFWSFLASAAVELVNYLLLFTKTSDAEPFRHARSPSKSRRRPSDIKFAFSFPTLRLGSRHSVEFEGVCRRLM